MPGVIQAGVLDQSRGLNLSRTVHLAACQYSADCPGGQAISGRHTRHPACPHRYP